MKVEIQSLFPGSNKWINMLIEKKFGELLKMVPGTKRCQVFLRVNCGNRKDDKIVEIKIFAYGKTVFGFSQAETFESAVHESCVQLRKQIRQLERISDLSIN